MRFPTRTLAVVAATALTVALTACSSSGGSKPSKSSAPSGTKPLASYAKLTGTSTTVSLTPTFVAELGKLGLAPSAGAPATLSGGRIAFPVTGGQATVYAKGAKSPQVTGSVTHSGGIKLVAKSINVELTDFVLKFGATSTLSGKVVLNGQPLGNTSLTMFDLDTSTMAAPTTSGGSTTLSGATVYVDPTAASSLNTAFNLTGTKNALPTTAKSLEVGTATVVLKG